jgi:hypothetical protein
MRGKKYREVMHNKKLFTLNPGSQACHHAIMPNKPADKNKLVPKWRDLRTAPTGKHYKVYMPQACEYTSPRLASHA